jgi:hypothetical protein
MAAPDPALPAASEIPDLPVPSAEPGPAPSLLWVPARPADYGFPPPVVAAIYAADLAVAVTAALALRRFLRKRRPRPPAPPAPPARQEALERFDSLGRLLERTPLREVALQASAILRHFADREYGIGLTAQTADEFRQVVSSTPGLLPGTYGEEILSYLERCDGAKFQPVADSLPLKQGIWREGQDLVRRAPLPASPP